MPAARRASILALLGVVSAPALAAFTCPPMPAAVTSVSTDIKSDISASIGGLGKIKVGEIAIKTETAAKNLFAKYPNVDKMLALQTMSATYCDMLKSTTALREVEKLRRTYAIMGSNGVVITVGHRYRHIERD